MTTNHNISGNHLHASKIELAKNAARSERSFDEHYRKLTGDQVQQIYALTKFGYTLDFVRSSGEDAFAYLDCGDNHATVKPDGEVVIGDDSVRLRGSSASV